MFQTCKLVGSRLHVVVTELDEADTSAYRTTMLAFINALIMAAPHLKDRNKIRNELISMSAYSGSGCREVLTYLGI